MPTNEEILAALKNEPIFFSHLNVPKGKMPSEGTMTSGPLIRPWAGTPAEIYNDSRSSGMNRDQARQDTINWLRKSQDSFGRIFRPDYPRLDTDEEMEKFLQSFQGM